MTSKLIFLFLCIFSLKLTAQESKWNFSLNMGKSWPLGKFSEDAVNRLNSGFAQKGFALTLESNYALNDNFSFKGIVLLNTNSLNRLPLWTNLNNRLNNAISIGPTDQQYISLNTNPWVSNSLMVGPVYTFVLNNFKMDFFACGGFAMIYLPQTKLVYQNPANDWIYLNRNTNPAYINYSFCTGTALRYPISEKFDFRVAVNYFSSRATQKFEEVKITVTESSTVTDQLNTSKAIVPINIISATMGLVYYLK